MKLDFGCWFWFSMLALILTLRLIRGSDFVLIVGLKFVFDSGVWFLMWRCIGFQVGCLVYDFALGVRLCIWYLANNVGVDSGVHCWFWCGFNHWFRFLILMLIWVLILSFTFECGLNSELGFSFRWWFGCWFLFCSRNLKLWNLILDVGSDFRCWLWCWCCFCIRFYFYKVIPTLIWTLIVVVDVDAWFGFWCWLWFWIECWRSFGCWLNSISIWTFAHEIKLELRSWFWVLI